MKNDHGKITSYEHSLQAMGRLLTAVNEMHWANWIREDINRWQNDRDTSHHLSAYGGMGSFNDVLICRANQHNIMEAQEPWIGTLFNWLKEVCYYLAKHPDDKVTSGDLKKAGEFANAHNRLSGWRCLVCGYSETSNKSIDWFIAQDLIPDMVFLGCEKSTLNDLVGKVLAIDIPNLAETRRELVASTQASGITINDRVGVMQQCPKCSQSDTALYRWRLLPDQAGRFEPSDNNLLLKHRKK